MEKKGEVLNQLAIISDLLENVNVNALSSTVVLELNSQEFENVYLLIQKKYGSKMERPKDKFTITIGMVDFVFSKSNV
jgi:hypothetical protein